MSRSIVITRKLFFLVCWLNYWKWAKGWFYQALVIVKNVKVIASVHDFHILSELALHYQICCLSWLVIQRYFTNPRLKNRILLKKLLWVGLNSNEFLLTSNCRVNLENPIALSKVYFFSLIILYIPLHHSACFAFSLPSRVFT